MWWLGPHPAAHIAAFASHDDALQTLAETGAGMDALKSHIYGVLIIAAVANDPEIVSLVMELGNRPDLITSIYDSTVLITAAHLGHHNVVGRLIAGGAPLDHVNNLSRTALMEAVVLSDGGSIMLRRSARWSMLVPIPVSRIGMGLPRFNRQRRAGIQPSPGSYGQAVATKWLFGNERSAAWSVNLIEGRIHQPETIIPVGFDLCSGST